MHICENSDFWSFLVFSWQKSRVFHIVMHLNIVFDVFEWLQVVTNAQEGEKTPKNEDFGSWT